MNFGSTLDDSGFFGQREPIDYSRGDAAASSPLDPSKPKTASAFGGVTGQGYDHDGEQCDPGYKKRPTADGFECVPDGSGGGGSHNCDAGYVWNEARQTCEGGDCPPGQTFHGPTGKCQTICQDGYALDRDGKCMDLNMPTGSGSGSGSGSGGGGGGSSFTPPKQYEFEKWVAPAKTPFDMDLERELSGFLGDWDKTVPFTPGVVQNMKTSAFRNSFGRRTADKNAIEADAIQRGVFQGDHTGDRLDNAQRGYESQFANDSREIDSTAAIQNDSARYRNRIAALDRAQQHVDNERNFLLASEMGQFERQMGMAQISQAYYRLAQERWAAQNQFNLAQQGLNNQSSQFNLSLQYKILQALQAA